MLLQPLLKPARRRTSRRRPHDRIWAAQAGLYLARAAAGTLDLNCALIMVTVCRNLITVIRGSAHVRRRGAAPAGWARRLLTGASTGQSGAARLLDKNIAFHKLLAYTILVGALLHMCSHFFNFQNLENTGNTLCTGLQPGTTMEQVAFTTIAGLTGQFLMLVMFLMYSSAVELIRRSFFEVFWYTHHLFLVFFGLLLAHGTGGLIQMMVCDGSASCGGTVAYGPTPPQFWKWAVGPLGLYLFERLVRFWRSQQHVLIYKVVQHPSKVFELQLKKPGFRSEPGQYVFLNCPSFRYFEWHPFTLTSAPEEDYFSVHIRVVGDWTEKLASRLGCNFKQRAPPTDAEIINSVILPKICVDGPYGTASSDVFEFEVAMLIGAGIGVTPFASILKSIWYRLCAGSTRLKLKRVYFFWINRDKESFEWFSDIIDALDQQLAARGTNDFLDARVYLTEQLDANVAMSVIQNSSGDTDAITGLRTKTNFGRPNWELIFKQTFEAHPATDIGVFFCGPKALSTELHKMCVAHSDPRQGGTRFFYNKENF